MEEDILYLQQSKTVRFARLVRICTKWFGEPRVTGSHHVFKTPWKGDPRVNLQRAGKDAKPYQVKQVIAALERLSGGNEDEL
ncbi:type II toxin-antitoxin system HicA family toxin [Microvenator marinus]|uniref:Type II toxin-antitoxin system HicA family toxin n=1 Tax=Microvenator marinus TaxID=2600177 RepID=A0A5B8XV73_9DELT|nr:type II toxin-antitoxin system HicA family toxin [Microvenator marinus]QED29314.1 type II toxin-antitoxin system HicA family toxin [Microvenator marinus]